MRLARQAPAGRLIPLTPLVDVMLILLVFFMVTSTWLDLDMIPAAGPASEDGAAAPQPSDPANASGLGTGAAVALLRLDPRGRAIWRGVAYDRADLAAALGDARQAEPALRLRILPSGRAPLQALVTVLEAAAEAGITDTRVLRLEPRP
ncbi:MAG: biopolymer transporter ExbD [Pseudomonadota bacterium]